MCRCSLNVPRELTVKEEEKSHRKVLANERHILAESMQRLALDCVKSETVSYRFTIDPESVWVRKDSVDLENSEK